MDNLAARLQMVDQQIRTWEVLDPRVLDVFAQVPREAFVPAEFRELAFADASIPIGFGQSMLAPKLQGRILQALNLTRRDRMLEVGTGTGYLAACASLLARETKAIEILPDLAKLAVESIASVPAAQVTVEARDAFAAAPLGQFDAIAITGSLPVYDKRIEQALAIGGRLFVVVGVPPVMEARLIRRVDAEEWVAESLFETVIPPLTNATPAQRFIF
jgi:protein-L-isoaspartate(D-aspartate) O-methyltransferase